MANVYEGTANFIHGLSDLWTRFFRDKPRLEAMYKGTEILAGQAYLDLVGNILCLSQREIPIFRKEFFKLLTVREDLITERDDGNWEFEVTDAGIKDFQYLYNKIFDPTVVLEKNIHFVVDNDLIDAVVFYTNPFDWDGAGGLIPGVASRTVEVLGDDGSTTTERELAFWIPDAQIDNHDMYLNFGHLIGRFEPSSEAYRSLIQGITQYFTLGPTQEHLLSALNVIVGLSVVRDDGEVLQNVNTSGEDENIVVTDRANYSFPKIVPLKDEILDTANWGVLELSAFESLTTVFQVYDTIIDPTWWFDREIPLQLLPDEDRLRRQVTPQMYENVVNNPLGLVHVGDPGLFVGADDDGYVPLVDTDHPTVYTGPGYEDNTDLWRPTYRHGFGYITYERFLKYHTFVVDFDHEVLQAGILPFDLLAADLGNIVDAGRSAYTYMIAEPGILFTDRVKVDQDVLWLYLEHDLGTELMTYEDTTLRVGETSVVVGDYYRYTAPDTITVYNAPWPEPLPDGLGNTPVVIGGDDPSKTIITEKLRSVLVGSSDLSGSEVGLLSGIIFGAISFTEDDVGRLATRGSTYHKIIGITNGGRSCYITPSAGFSLPQVWDIFEGSPAACGDQAVQIAVSAPVWLGGSSVYYWGDDGSAMANPVPGSTGETVRGVYARTGDEIWAVGDISGDPVKHLWNGTSWSSDTSGSDAVWNSVWSGSASEAYVCGYDPTTSTALIEQWNGSAWSSGTIDSPSNVILTALMGVPTGERIAVGYSVAGATHNGVALLKYGTSWFTLSGVPTGHELLGGWSPQGGHGWACGCVHDGSQQEGAIFYSDGSTWTKEYDGGVTTGVLNAMWGTRFGNIWCVGEDSAVLHRDDTGTWTKLTTFPVASLSLTSVWGYSDNDVYVVGNSGTTRYLFQTKDGGATWITRDSESTSDGYFAVTGVGS